MENLLYLRLENIEKRLDMLEKSSAQELVTNDLIKQGLSSFNFFHTEKNYYGTSLSARANFLHANVCQLCKTVLFENTLTTSTSKRDISDSKYYCVVVQYQAKIDVDLLRDAIINLRCKDKLPHQALQFHARPR